MKFFILILLFILFYLIYRSYSLEHYFDAHIKLTPQKKKELVQCMNLFNNLCNENNLYYIISFGTLLGSVRHKGLIPWDDDIDLIMYFDDIDTIKKLLNDFSNKYGYKIFHEWKLSRIYINDEIFIDIFYVQNQNNNVVRCSYNDDNKSCIVLDKDQEWWHKWFNFPYEYIKDRQLFEFEGYQFYGPKEWSKLLSFWYGPTYMTECKTHYLKNHNEIIEQENIKCYYENLI
jgi:phosphorylcholine metabolism protein LicD